MSGLPIGRPRFVTIEEVIGWHETAIAQYGGRPGLRDRSLLESALAQPQQGAGGQFAHEYPFGMAAAYAYHIAKNHPFADGNKRAALVCCGAFLRMNGWDLVSSGTEAADAILDVVAGKTDKTTLAGWLQSHSRLRPSMELRDFFATIDIARVHDRLESATVSRSHAELNASAEEAAHSSPLVRSLFEASRGCYEQGDKASGGNLGNQAMLLVALYRIAEDLGYEW